MILLIDNYDSFTHNLAQTVMGLGRIVVIHRNDKITLDEIALMKPGGIILSPGPGRPDEAGVCLDTIKTFSGKIPIFGVCLGHQAIAQAFGGRVISASKIVHGCDDLVHHNKNGLLKGLPNPFSAGRYHSLMVDEGNLPNCLEVDGVLQGGTIMSLHHKLHPTFGVQFHPESVLTPLGENVILNFLKLCQAPARLAS